MDAYDQKQHEDQELHADDTVDSSQRDTVEGLAEGALIAEQYRVISLLGTGASSHVYRCEDTESKQVVAVKLIKIRPGTPPESMQRLEIEGIAVAKLQHPNIAKVHSSSVWQEQVLLVMELCPGVSLTHVLATQGPLPLFRVQRLVQQLSNALSYAHQHGVIHRDLKPSNVMLIDAGTEQEWFKLLDFSMAKIIEDQSIKAAKAGKSFGGAAYISPEQALGKPIDEKTDQYSLGCLIFETLTGRPPFQAESQLSVLMQQVKQEPPSLSSVNDRDCPESVELTVSRMLAKKKKDRFDRIDDVMPALLGDWTGDQPAMGRKAKIASIWIGVVFLFGSAVTWLQLQHLPKAAQTPVSADSQAPSLTSTGPTLNDDDKWVFTQMSGNPNISQLNLGGDQKQARSHTHIDGAGMQLILFFGAHLTNLDLSHCKDLRDDDLKWLQSLSLTNLNLSSTTISDSGLSKLMPMKTITTLNVEDNPAITDAGLTCLNKLSIEHLNASRTNVEGRAFAEGWQSLKFLNLDQTHIKESLISLTNLPVEDLSLAKDSLTDSEMQTVAKFKHVTHLVLDDNKISDIGLLKLVAMPNVQVLHMSGCSVTEKGAAAFKKLKQSCKVVF